ncbi:probable G-protein coupled receptor No18 [Amphiura filiformis]|uniref:probable G-protein coupled receptor No18 n=1 Tax=Amphiura filiformis TaxID=82378 RepID=UPI003B212A1F
MTSATMDTATNSLRNASSYDERSDIWTASVAATLSLIAFLTIAGNILMMLSYVKDPRIRSSVGNFYVLNRAIADLMVGVFVIPFGAVSLIIGSWPFGDTFCKLWTVVESSATFVSVLSLLLISLDRYWLVTKKLRYQKFQTQQRAAFLICCCWILCIVFYGVTVFAWKPITKIDFPVDLITECRLQSTNNLYFAIVLFFVQFLLPLVLIAGLNRVVYRRIRARSRSFVQSTSPMPPVTSARNKEEAAHAMNGQCATTDQCNPSVDGNRTLKKTDSSSGLRCIDEGVTSVSLISVKTLPEEDSVATEATERETESTERSSSPSNEVTADNDTAEVAIKDVVVVAGNTKGNRPSTIIIPNAKISKGTRHRKAGVTLAVLVSIYVICWFPHCLVVLLNSGCKNCIPKLAVLITTYLHWCISTINPYLYAVLNDKFRAAFSKLLGFSNCTQRKSLSKKIAVPNYTTSATGSGPVHSSCKHKSSNELLY